MAQRGDRAAVAARPASASFVWDPAVARLSTITDLAALLGFTDQPDVVRTYPGFLAHLPDADRDRWTAGAAECARTGAPQLVLHHLRTADGTQRLACSTFTTTGTTTGTTDAGRPVQVVVVDLDHHVQTAVHAQLREAVSRATESRGVIEQAKGVIMTVLDIDPDQAFDLLRWHSSHTNTKLRDISVAVVTGMTGDGPRTSPRLRLSGIFSALGTAPVARAGWTRPTAPDSDNTGPSDTAGSAPAVSQHEIPAALLPGILTRAVADASVAITVADMTLPDRPLVYVNAAFEELTGYTAGDVLGRNCRFLQGDRPRDEQNAAIREAMAQGVACDTLIRNFRADGTPFWNEFHLSPVRNAHGRLTHYVGYQLDVTERVEREDQLHRLAYQDPATGLPNRAAALSHREALDDAGTSYTVVTVTSDQFGDHDALDHSDQRLVTILTAQRLREAVPGVYLARTDTRTLQLIGDVPDPAVLHAALQRPVDTTEDVIDLAVSVVVDTDAGRTTGRS